MSNQNSSLPIAADGESSHSRPKDIVTGNCAAEAEKTEKPDISESGKSPADSTLPKWLSTNPEILAGQLHDILTLMQAMGWFVYAMPVTATDGKRKAIRVTISPPLEHVIGIEGPLHEQVITMDGKPVV